MADQATAQDAQRAYEAYAEHQGGKTYQGLPIPPWAEVRPDIQAAWGAAVQAVLAGRTEKGDDTQQRHNPNAPAVPGPTVPGDEPAVPPPGVGEQQAAQARARQQEERVPEGTRQDEEDEPSPIRPAAPPQHGEQRSPRHE